MKIDKSKVQSQDINYFIHDTGESWQLRDKEHYRLLTYLSNNFNNINILDLGTYQGYSALALCQNPNNNVYSYDIESKNISFADKYKNLKFKTMDILLEDQNVIKSAELILLDIDPHNGIQEKRFTDILESIGYEGYVICDDIFINNNMFQWWNSIIRPKYDLTDIGHIHGTGLICYNRSIEIV